MVIKFEEYLIEQGYKCYEDKEKGKELNPYNYHLSTTDLLSVYYKKGEDIFIIGLNESRYPPTLISPKPKVKCEVIEFEKGIKIKEQIRGGIMSDILNRFTNKEIYNSCVNKVGLDYKINFEENILNKLPEHLKQYKIINRKYESN